MLVSRVLALSFVLSFPFDLMAAPSAFIKCKNWLQVFKFSKPEKLNEEVFLGINKRVSFQSAEQNDPAREFVDQARVQFHQAIDFLKKSKWKEDQRKVLEFLFKDDTLEIGLDLSSRATMVSSRLNKAFLVISLKDLFDKETWVHEAAHWWTLNEYPQITELYQKVQEEAELHPRLEIAIDLRNALQLWFEIKANEISMANSSASLESFQIYQELTEYWTKKLRFAWPDSKSKAKALRMKLKEEILSLIRWGYGVKLDDHHLQLFE